MRSTKGFNLGRRGGLSSLRYPGREITVRKAQTREIQAGLHRDFSEPGVHHVGLSRLRTCGFLIHQPTDLVGGQHVAPVRVIRIIDSDLSKLIDTRFRCGCIVPFPFSLWGTGTTLLDDQFRRCQPAGVRQSRPARSSDSSTSPNRSFLTPRESRSFARVTVTPWPRWSSTRSSRLRSRSC